jgi:hypothetical protein
MRFWFSGPRMFNGLVRPGVSFGPEDLRARRVPATTPVNVPQHIRRENELLKAENEYLKRREEILRK